MARHVRSETRGTSGLVGGTALQVLFGPQNSWDYRMALSRELHQTLNVDICMYTALDAEDVCAKWLCERAVCGKVLRLSQFTVKSIIDGHAITAISETIPRYSRPSDPVDLLFSGN